MNRPGKREARIERKKRRQVQSQNKKVRLVERIADELVDRSARAQENPDSIFDMQVSWNRDDPDVIGRWSWGVDRQWSNGDWTTLINPKLNEFEQLTWGEIDQLSSGAGHKMHHNMNTEDVCKEAKDRLIEIEKHPDTLFRFRLGNKKRLWGIRTVDEFSILWFDPTHDIYPTE